MNPSSSPSLASSPSSSPSTSPKIPSDLFPVYEELQFRSQQRFDPQQHIKAKHSFASKIFSKGRKQRKDGVLDDASDAGSIRTMNSTASSGGGSIRSMMFSRKHRTNTSVSTNSDAGSVFSNASWSSNASTKSAFDKYGMPKNEWIPVGF